MKTPSFLRTTYLMRMGLVLTAIIITLAAGVSILVFQSPLSPLFVGGILVAILICLFILHKPFWALGAAIVIGFIQDELFRTSDIPIMGQYPGVFFITVAFLFWLYSTIVHHKKINWTITSLLLLGFIFWGSITLFWAEDVLMGRRTLVTFIIGFILVLLIFNEVDSEQTLNQLMTTLAIGGWIVVLASIWTVVSQGYIPGTRLQVLGLNENKLGVILLVTMPGVLWQTIGPDGRKNVAKFWMAATFLLLSIVIILMSGSRGSIISLVIMLVAWLIFKPTRLWGVIALSSMALMAIFASTLYLTTAERFAVTQGDTFLGGREAIWQASWNLILDHPWRGVGIGNGRQALVPYTLRLMTINGDVSVPSHNPIMQIWIETGLPGILLYLAVPTSAIWLFILRYSRYNLSENRKLPLYWALTFSMLAGFAISWFKGGGTESDFLYFLVLSLLLTPVALVLKEQDRKTRPAQQQLANSSTPYSD
jgi:O-antigen ligase